MTYRPFREGSRRFLLTVNALAWAAAMAAAPGVVAAQESGNGPRLEELKRLELPEEIARASDVRWLADGELVLGVIGRGLYSWRVGRRANSGWRSRSLPPMCSMSAVGPLSIPIGMNGTTDV